MAERPNGRRALGGAPHGAPSRGTPGPAVSLALAAELEGVLVDAIAGRSAHEALGPLLQREARAVLLRHGLAAAQVGVTQAGGECRVDVMLPARQPVVLRLRVDLG